MGFKKRPHGVIVINMFLEIISFIQNVTVSIIGHIFSLLKWTNIMFK